MTQKTKCERRKFLPAEKAAITQFLFDEAEPDPDALTPFSTVFERYKAWRDELGLNETDLVIDGFGRLFPHIYERRAHWDKKEKRTKLFVFGMKLK